jgi:hypothetical protein
VPKPVEPDKLLHIVRKVLDAADADAEWFPAT